MPQLVTAAPRKRTRSHRRRIRTLWITVIVLGSIMVIGAIVLASMDGSFWLNGPDGSSSDLIHP